MGKELLNDVSAGIPAYYPPKKQLLVCGTYGDGEKKGRSYLNIYNTGHELVKSFAEPCAFDIVNIDNAYDNLERAMKEHYVTRSSRYRLCGVSCNEHNRVIVYIQVVGGDYVTLRIDLDMDTYSARMSGYDPR